MSVEKDVKEIEMSQSLLVLSVSLENVTLGEIMVCVTVILGVIAGVNKVKKAFKDFKATINGWVVEELKPQFVTINERLDGLEKRNERQDMENVKNYLVLFMANIERNEKPDEVEMLRFEEQYEYYVNKGWNSYIKKKYHKLKEEGKL